MGGDVAIGAAAALDADDCRRLVLASEPWITLGYAEGDVQALVRSAATDNLLLARADGRVIGFALSASGILLGEYLKILVVEPAARTQGIGRRLMGALERRAFQRWPNVYLCVSDFNAAARSFLPAHRLRGGRRAARPAPARHGRDPHAQDRRRVAPLPAHVCVSAATLPGPQVRGTNRFPPQRSHSSAG